MFWFTSRVVVLASLLFLAVGSAPVTAQDKAPIGTVGKADGADKGDKVAAPALGISNEVTGLKLPIDQTVEPKEGFVLIAADTKADEVKWIVVGTIPVKYSTMGKTVVLGTPPGAVIYVYAYAAIDGKATDPARTVITVRDTKPVVSPAPPTTPDKITPPPVPPAAAVTGPLHVVLVEDPLARGKFPYVADIVNDKALRDAIEKAGHKWRVLDIRDPEFTRAKLAPHVQAAGGTPALIILDKNGVVYRPQLLPKTSAAVVEAVNAVARGGK